jgi:hypothetical protein
MPLAKTYILDLPPKNQIQSMLSINFNLFHDIIDHNELFGLF